MWISLKSIRQNDFRIGKNRMGSFTHSDNGTKNTHQTILERLRLITTKLFTFLPFKCSQMVLCRSESIIPANKRSKKVEGTKRSLPLKKSKIIDMVWIQFILSHVNSNVYYINFVLICKYGNTLATSSIKLSTTIL